MQHLFRKHEGDDQLDMFDTRKARRMGFAEYGLVGSLVLMLVIGVATVAQAQAVTVVRNGVLCKTVDELKKTIDWIAENPHAKHADLSDREGCGYVQRPFPARITPYTGYENKSVRIVIGRFDSPLGVLYGWIDYQLKPPEIST